MQIQNILFPIESNFPSSNDQLKEFAKNISENAEKASGGQVRKSANWFSSVLAKSMLNVPAGFNINTLKAEYTNLDKITFVDALSSLNHSYAKSSLLLEDIGEKFLLNHKSLVSVWLDEDCNEYAISLRINRGTDSKVYTSCGCGDLDLWDDCEMCDIAPMGSHVEKLDAIAHAINLIKDTVDVPCLKDMIYPKERDTVVKYLAIMQDSECPTLIKPIYVTLVNPSEDYQSKVEKKAKRFLASDGYNDDDFEMLECIQSGFIPTT